MISGITLFLILARAASVFTSLQNWVFALASIVICLIGPILYLMYQLICNLKHADIHSDGIQVSTRFKSAKYLWTDIDKIAMCQVKNSDLTESLGVIVIPKDAQKKAFHINLDLSLIHI